jgi:hypothetical protein
VSERKSFLLRVDRELLDAVQRWANDDLRSLNGQIEFLLRDSLKRARRHTKRTAAAPAASPAEASAAHESEPEE